MKHWFLFLFSASEYWFMANVGCLPFTNSCRKIRWQRKCLISHWVVPAVNFRQQRNIWKGSPVFRTEYSKRKFVFNFFKAIFDTGFRPSRRFFGNLICTNAIPGRHLPVLNFPYHELYPNCESTGLPMQMVNNLCIRFHVQPELLPSWSQTMGTAGPCRLTPIVPDIFGTVSSTDTKPKLGPLPFSAEYYRKNHGRSISVFNLRIYWALGSIGEERQRKRLQNACAQPWLPLPGRYSCAHTQGFGLTVELIVCA